MEIEKYDHGVPCWVDMGTPDPERASAFYSALFGWDIAEGPPEAGGYRIATLRGRPVAGLGPVMNPDAPPAWVSYVNVTSVDDTVAKVSDAGGQVFMPGMDVMDVGRMAVIADQAGAVFALWQAMAHIGAYIVNEPNTLCWNELITTDIDGSKLFYESLFGWGAETHGEAGPGGYTEWKVGDRKVGGMIQKPPFLPAEAPPFWAVYFAVEDADATVAKIKELGGSVMMEPMDIEPGRFAVAADPTGPVFSILQLAKG